MRSTGISLISRRPASAKSSEAGAATISALHWHSDFLSVGEVAGVAEAGDDVGMGGEFFIDGGYPEGHLVGRKVFLDIIHGVDA